MTATIDVLDAGRLLRFSVQDMLAYSGPGSPGGVAQAFKVLERALPLLGPQGPPERREITVRTSFAGPGVRDAMELVTRAVTHDRYTVDAALGRPELGRTREHFVFELGYRDRAVTLVVRPGIVTEEFIDLASNGSRTEEQEERLDRLKLAMFDQVMAMRADEVYDVEQSVHREGTGAG
jgi:hypothetical protein